MRDGDLLLSGEKSIGKLLSFTQGRLDNRKMFKAHLFILSWVLIKNGLTLFLVSPSVSICAVAQLFGKTRLTRLKTRLLLLSLLLRTMLHMVFSLFILIKNPLTGGLVRG